MRILVLNWRDITHPHAGGAEVYIHEVAKRWAKQGNEITLLCGSYNQAAPLDYSDGIRIIRSGNEYTIYLKAIVEYLRRRHSYDVIVESVNTVPFLAPLYSSCPVVSVIYQWTSLRLLLGETLPPLAVCATALQSLIPFVHRSNGVITISESSKSELVRHGFLSNNIIVVRPGLNPELYSRYDVEHKPFSKNIIYLGRLKRYKGVIDLLKVFRNLTHFHREARLYIVGKGDLLYELVNLRRRLDLENKVFITGYVTEEVKSLLLYKSAVIVYNGKQFDGGWSIACAEGMALGAVPVVSTYLKDMVVESGSGFVFKADNSSQLCNALSRLLEDEKTWRHMSLKGSQWVRSFTWDRTANETFTAIERFLGSSEGRTR